MLRSPPAGGRDWLIPLGPRLTPESESGPGLEPARFLAVHAARERGRGSDARLPGKAQVLGWVARAVARATQSPGCFVAAPIRS